MKREEFDQVSQGKAREQRVIAQQQQQQQQQQQLQPNPPGLPSRLYCISTRRVSSLQSD